MNNAANFAFVNRLSLGLMAVRALSENLGRDLPAQLVYDAPHNFIEAVGNDGLWRYRKGAAPAWVRRVFIIKNCFRLGIRFSCPGSMGAGAWVGSPLALVSVARGAGRVLSRGRAAHEIIEQDLEDLRVVTPVDPQKMRAQRL